MKIIHQLFLWTSVYLCIPTAVAQGQLPEGFHWVDFRKEATTLSSVERALTSEEYTVVREVGVLNDFALVMTVNREPGQATPMGDVWQVYNVSMKDWSIHTLIAGYNLEIKDWIKFEAKGPLDLAVQYLDCWECEPATTFTALHFDPQKGWRARWSNGKNPVQPGITMLITDVGDPYTNEDVDQVFAVLAPRDGLASVGTWYHSKDLGTGKISDTVSKFFVQKGEDKSVDLAGTEASNWRVRLCKPGNASFGVSGGQDSRVCKSMINSKKSQ